MDDTQLLRDYVENNSEPAFARLVEQHLDLVYSAALRRVSGDHHRAEEVTQMVFTDLARKAGQLQHHPLLAGWLHRSTRWAAATLRRTEQRRIANEQAAAIDPSADNVAEPTADWEKLAPLLDRALDSLGEADRDAVLLRFFNNRPFAEIGATLGLSENAARMRVERALARLQSLLSKRGITPTAIALGLALTQNAVSAAPTSTTTTVSATALASVGTATTGFGLTLFFMNKLQIAAASLLAIGLASGLFLQARENHRLQRQLDSLNAQKTTALADLTKLKSQTAVLDSRLRQLDQAIAEQLPPLTPEQQERVHLDTIIRKGELDNEYTSLFRRLKLDPVTLDKFKTLLVERNQAIYDARKLAKSHGAEPTSIDKERLLADSAAAEIDQRSPPSSARNASLPSRTGSRSNPFGTRQIGSQPWSSTSITHPQRLIHTKPRPTMNASINTAA